MSTYRHYGGSILAAAAVFHGNILIKTNLLLMTGFTWKICFISSYVGVREINFIPFISFK